MAYAEFADPQSLNLYSYVRNVPTTRFDADGHQDDLKKELPPIEHSPQPWPPKCSTDLDEKVANFVSFNGWKTDAQVAADQAAKDSQDRADWAKAYPLLPYPDMKIGIVVPVEGMGAAPAVEEAVSVYQKAETPYVGITKDLAQRELQHGEKLKEVVGGLTRPQAKGVEQAIIEQKGLAKNGGQLTNMINSIARTNPIYKEAVEFGRQVLKSIGF